MMPNLPQQWGILRALGATSEVEDEKVAFTLIASYRFVFSRWFPTLVVAYATCYGSIEASFISFVLHPVVSILPRFERINTGTKLQMPS